MPSAKAATVINQPNGVKAEPVTTPDRRTQPGFEFLRTVQQ